MDKQVANANHISQICQATHGLRVKRHDQVVDMLSGSLRRAGYVVQVEPRIASGNSFVKPDIVCYRKQSAFVIDPIICGDNIDPEERALEKRLYYTRPEIEEYVKVSTNNTAISVEAHGLAISMRGAWATSSSNFFRRLRLPRKVASFITLRVLNATWHLLRTYDRCQGGRRGIG